MSGKPDGGWLAGRVLAYLYNPGRAKKVPVKIQKSDKILGSRAGFAEERGKPGGGNGELLWSSLRWRVLEAENLRAKAPSCMDT